VSESNGTTAIVKEMADKAREIKRREMGTPNRPSFDGFVIPMQNGTGDPAKAWPKGMPPEMAAKAKAIREDKARRDRAKAKGS
jgi:hypothetical protein